MANNVEFYDYSETVKKTIKGIVVRWLLETANEIVSHVKRKVSTKGWTNAERTSLRDSYNFTIDTSNGVAKIGSTLEQSFWEEFGTGSHADTAKNGGKQGRSGWWIYTPDDNDAPEGYKSNEYATEEDAKEMAAYIEAAYGKKAVVTDGREPNYTLEKAYLAVKPKAIKQLERELKGMR